MLSLFVFMTNDKIFGVPPETSPRTTSGTRTTGWEPLVYSIRLIFYHELFSDNI